MIRIKDRLAYLMPACSLEFVSVCGKSLGDDDAEQLLIARVVCLS